MTIGRSNIYKMSSFCLCLGYMVCIRSLNKMTLTSHEFGIYYYLLYANIGFIKTI